MDLFSWIVLGWLACLAIFCLILPKKKDESRVVSFPGSAHGDLPRGRTGDKR
jgi:hypothetical protein